MWEFLQSYGIWILSGALFLVMMRFHGHGSHGGGCGMGRHEHTGPQDERDKYADEADARDRNPGSSCH